MIRNVLFWKLFLRSGGSANVNKESQMWSDFVRERMVFYQKNWHKMKRGNFTLLLTLVKSFYRQSLIIQKYCVPIQRNWHKSFRIRGRCSKVCLFFDFQNSKLVTFRKLHTTYLIAFSLTSF